MPQTQDSGRDIENDQAQVQIKVSAPLALHVNKLFAKMGEALKYKAGNMIRDKELQGVAAEVDYLMQEGSWSRLPSFHELAAMGDVFEALGKISQYDAGKASATDQLVEAILYLMDPDKDFPSIPKIGNSTPPSANAWNFKPGITANDLLALDEHELRELLPRPEDIKDYSLEKLRQEHGRELLQVARTALSMLTDHTKKLPYLDAIRAREATLLPSRG